MDSDFTKLDSFCVAPWVNLHLDSQGFRRACCLAERAPKELKESTVQEFRNSEYLRSLRTQMMRGEIPPDCRACKSPNTPQTYRQELNSRLGSHLDSILKFTDHDGFIQLKDEQQNGLDVLYLDYRDASCNLSCKTCGVEASTTWLKNLQLQWPIWRQILSEDYLRDAQHLLANRSKKNEFLEVLQVANPAILYFAGGEPLLSANHNRAMRYLIESGKSQNIQLFYNTNLSISSAQIMAWLDQLNFFQKSFLSCSLDGVGEVGEYIRSGLNFRRFVENLELLTRDQTKRVVMLDCTVTSLLLFDPISIAELALQFQIQVFSKFMTGREGSSKFLRCEFLPKDLRHSLMQRWREYYLRLSSAEQALLFRLNDTLEMAVSLPEFSVAEYPEIIKQLNCHELAFREEGRFFEFVNQRPEGREWQHRIYSAGKSLDSPDKKMQIMLEQSPNN